MDVGIWVVIVGVLLVLAVVLDSYRRVRSERSIHDRIAETKAFAEDGENNPELPNGGARVISRTAAPPQARVIADTPVSAADIDESYVDADAPILPDAEELGALVLSPEDAIDEQAVPAEDPGPSVSLAGNGGASVQKPKPSSSAAGGNADGAEEILQLHVMAAEGEMLPGSEILEILLACDVRFGAMNIFHRHEKPNGEGEPQFSVVNMVKPGFFELETMAEMQTPGVSFFLRMPGPEQPMQAFDYMVETARCLAKNLNANLADETRSVVTSQTIQHMKQRIRDFERHQLTLV